MKMKKIEMQQKSCQIIILRRTRHVLILSFLITFLRTSYFFQFTTNSNEKQFNFYVQDTVFLRTVSAALQDQFGPT